VTEHVFKHLVTVRWWTGAVLDRVRLSLTLDRVEKVDVIWRERRVSHLYDQFSVPVSNRVEYFSLWNRNVRRLGYLGKPFPILNLFERLEGRPDRFDVSRKLVPVLREDEYILFTVWNDCHNV